MIIGLTGLKNSGKDTVGAYLIKEHGFERRAFADPGKKMIASMLDIGMWEIDKLKNDESCFVTLGNKNEPEIKFVGQPAHMWSPIREQDFRAFLQNFFESAKVIFGEDVWVNQVLPVDGFYGGKAIVLTDLRFHAEANRIKELGGYIMRIERPDVEQNHHRSEVEQHTIVADCTIRNDATIEDLYIRVTNALDNLLVGNGP